MPRRRRDYWHHFEDDLAGNRMAHEIDLGNDNHASPDETITYEYNGRDQLTLESSTVSDDKEFQYDDNGSLTTKTFSDGITVTRTDTFAWDLRNRMISATVDGTTTAYRYDHDGVRVSQSTTGGSTTHFLNDANNPTGYTKAIEEKASPTASPTRSFVLGHTVEGQGDSCFTFRVSGYPVPHAHRRPRH